MVFGNVGLTQTLLLLVPRYIADITVAEEMARASLFSTLLCAIIRAARFCWDYVGIMLGLWLSNDAGTET
jgi:hypothetical protein